MIVLIIGILGTLISYRWGIKFLQAFKLGQAIRAEGPQAHYQKAGTPTMGGIVFVGVPLILWLIVYGRGLQTADIAVAGLMFGGFVIGLVDDYLIVVQHDNYGLRPLHKLLALFAIAGIFGASMGVDLSFSFWRVAASGWWLIPVWMVVINGTANAVNITDGIDGLAATTTIISLATLGVIACHQQAFKLLHLMVLVSGSLAGFLWFNYRPAKIFMGDCGSLALGTLIAGLAVVLKLDFLVLLGIGGLFYLEMGSVILQVSYFKYTKGKRIFKMSPIHHHYELSGRSEQWIVGVFSAVHIIMNLLALGYYFWYA